MTNIEAPEVSGRTIPERYRTAVVPHIMVDDAVGALDFYVRAFGAVEEYRLDAPGGGVLHAELSIGGAVLMLGDTAGGGFTAPTALGGTSVALHVFVADVDALVRTAAAAGAEVLQEPADQFHGDRTAHLRDPYGHTWIFLTHLEDVSGEEVERRLASTGTAQPGLPGQDGPGEDGPGRANPAAGRRARPAGPGGGPS